MLQEPAQYCPRCDGRVPDPNYHVCDFSNPPEFKPRFTIIKKEYKIPDSYQMKIMNERTPPCHKCANRFTPETIQGHIATCQGVFAFDNAQVIQQQQDLINLAKNKPRLDTQRVRTQVKNINYAQFARKSSSMAINQLYYLAYIDSIRSAFSNGSVKMTNAQSAIPRSKLRIDRIYNLMNSAENIVQCPICGEKIQARLFYYHQLEKTCKPLVNPNQPAFVQPSLIQNPSLVQNSDVIRVIPHSQIQGQFPRVEQSQPMTQSMINLLVIKCDFCQEEYPIEILQEHLECCPAKKELEQMQNELFDVPETQPVQRQHQPPVIRQRIPDFDADLSDEDFNGLDHFHNARVEHLDNSGRVQIRRMEQPARFPFDLPSQSFDPMRMIFGNGGINPPFEQQRRSQRRFDGPDHMHDFLNLLMRSIHPQDEPAHDVNELNVIVFQKSNNLAEEHTRCAICMSDYEDQEQLILLPCTHRYHAECIKKWLESHHECPVCKYDLNKQQQQ